MKMLDPFNTPDIKQLEKVLNHCGNGCDCAECDFDWMEDHGISCYRVCAKNSITYIKALKEMINTWDEKIDKLLEVLK